MVDGVTSYNDRLYVLRRPSHQQIEVYDVKTFTLLGTLPVEGLNSDRMMWSFGLTSCSINNCLYASDSAENVIYRIDIKSQLTFRCLVKKWHLQKNAIAISLSVNSASNVLITCLGVNKILEYTNSGSMCREICLQSEVTSCPQHAIQLSKDLFVVSHSGPEYGVSIVDVLGQVVHTYRNQSVSDYDRLKSPRHLAVDRAGRILVADSRNNRIIVLNSTLEYAHELTVSVNNGGLFEPWSLSFDKSGDLLFVGEGGGRHVVVLNIIHSL
jgi:NHL repeat